ncbi:hypothetical protein [Salibacterium aidingense]|nr:hypothetical protein [Salibacterium aidingense]
MFWRPVAAGIISLERAENMDMNELFEINAALDIYLNKNNM